MLRDDTTFWPVQRSLSNFRLQSPEKKPTTSSFSGSIETVERSPYGLVRSFTTLERSSLTSRRQSRSFLTSPIPRDTSPEKPQPLNPIEKAPQKPKLNSPIKKIETPRNPSKSPYKSVVTPRPLQTPRKPSIPPLPEREATSISPRKSITTPRKPSIPAIPTREATTSTSPTKSIITPRKPSIPAIPTREATTSTSPTKSITTPRKPSIPPPPTREATTSTSPTKSITTPRKPSIPPPPTREASSLVPKLDLNQLTHRDFSSQVSSTDRTPTAVSSRPRSPKSVSSRARSPNSLSETIRAPLSVGSRSKTPAPLTPLRTPSVSPIKAPGYESRKSSVSRHCQTDSIIDNLQKFESPYKKADKLHGMESAKPAFTIKPMANGGPTTSTPKPTLAGANSVSLRKMTQAEVKISPAEKARIEENKAKIAALSEQENDLKAQLKKQEEEEERRMREAAVTVKVDKSINSADASARPSVRGNIMVATDPSTFARNSINMVYRPKSKLSHDDKPKFDPDVFAKTIIRSSNLTMKTPRKEVQPITTTTTIASTAPEPEPAPVEQPISAVDSGIGLGIPLEQEEQQKEKKKEKKKRKDKSKLGDYEKLLKCPRCKKRFVEPKIVCCQRMCVECLQKFIDTKVKTGVLFCKICNRTIMIPDSSKPKRSWAKQFPSDMFLSNLKEAVVLLEGKRLCYVCDSRSKVTDATMFCYECDTYFCDECDDAHRHMPKLQHHRLVDLNNLTPTELMRNKKRGCSIHEGKTLELFCKDHFASICSQCASTAHQKCSNVVTIANLADEKRKMLRTTDKTVKAGIAKCEDSTKRLKGEASDIADLKKQAVQQIDGAFHAVTDALTSRRKKLLKDINVHFNEELPQCDNLAKQMDKIRTAMKANTEFIGELMNHASDLDVIENADRIRYQADTMVQQNAEVTETPKPKMIIRMDETAVQNFVELVSLLGAEVGSTQVKGLLVKKMTTKMSGDKSIPDIRDIVVMDSGALLVIDNKNSCVKGILFHGDQFNVKRLELKSEPWGGAKLQDNMIAVTGLRCFYIISLTDDLTLHNVVHTRKDYWGICALSPINLACSCKFPPCVDIVDITGRRLRTIDVDSNGRQLFDMPGYLGNVGGRIVVSDRTKKALICVDQLGDVVFTYMGEGEHALEFPRGLAIDRFNRIYVSDHDKGAVYLLSPEGQYLCTVIAVSKPRTICLDKTNNTLFVSMEGKGITFFNMIEIAN